MRTRVQLQQVVDRITHRLSFIPLAYVAGAVILVFICLVIDGRLVDSQVPSVFATTVPSARSVFAALAGGLITTFTLLLSMMLITVQLASSQFSPRTLRDWLGNRRLQHSIGIVLGTAVFCLLALRSTRQFDDEAGTLVPHVTVIVAVILGVASLIAVVSSVDDTTNRLRIGSVASRLASQTIDVIEENDRVEVGQDPQLTSVGIDPGQEMGDKPDEGAVVETGTAGWVQQIDDDSLLAALPEGHTATVVALIGGFVPAHSPLVWVSPPIDQDDPRLTELRDAIAIGDSRTMQQDVEFGLVQLTDIAVRALSPGVNDPTTACDIVVHLGDVMIALWAHPRGSTTVESDGRTVIRRRPTHAEYLDRAFLPILHYGREDDQVVRTMRATLELVRSEVVRRQLPGPLAPIDDLLERIPDALQDARAT